MARRWMKRLIIVGLSMAALLLLYDRALMMLGVGSTDLMIVLVVVDADSGDPISNAQIEVYPEGRRNDPFTMTTNTEGVATELCRETITTSRESGLGLTFTETVAVPWRRYQIHAEGYLVSDLIELDRHLPVHRSGPYYSAVVMTLAMQPE